MIEITLYDKETTPQFIYKQLSTEDEHVGEN